MSRTGFSIRKLINQRRTWPDSDDENEEGAFECSSAKTIRMQYELEQYQLQQLQKEGRHQIRNRSSWMNGSTSPKKSNQRRIPKPITVVKHANDDVTVQSGSASRRISTPLISSRSLTGRISPATAQSRGSDDSLCPFCGVDRSQEHQCQQYVNIPRRSASCLSPTQGNQLPRSLRPSSLSPAHAPAPLTKELFYEKPSPIHDTDMCLPSPGPRTVGHRAPSPRQPTPTAVYSRSVHVRTPSLKTPTDSAIHLASSSSGMSTHTPQQSAFINGQPSPPLEPEDKNRGQLRAVPSRPKLASDGESTWFLGEADEEQSVVPDSVQQLIWETDEAFKAVSSALADARQAPPPQSSSAEAQAHLQLQQAARFLQTQDAAANMPVLHNLPTTTFQGPTSASQSQLISPMSPTAGAGRGTFASPRKSSKSSPLSPSSSTRRSPFRGTSITKSKKGPKSPISAAVRSAPSDASPSRADPTGSPSKTHRHYHSLSYQRSIARLNLAADKVTDKIFESRGGRLGFIKVEADEVITPSQIQLYRQTRLAKAQAEAQADAKRAASSENLRSAAGSVGDESSSGIAGAENTHEPSCGTFNASPPVVDMARSQSLSTLDKDVARQSPIIAEPKTPTQTKEFIIGQNLLATPPATPPQLPTTFPAQTTNAEDDESMHLRNIGFPKLSSRRPSHTRAASATSHAVHLPTIPEVRVTAPLARDASRESQQAVRNSPGQTSRRPGSPEERNGPYFDEDDEHMFFMSTPLTATMPAFQHGRIRLAKADLVNAGTINSLESKLLTSPEETLDWTAFQMAILGGAGELFSDPDNFLSRDAQEEMVDDLCDWLECLGFSNRSLGSLVTKDERSSATVSPMTPMLQVQAAMRSTPKSANKAFHDPSCELRRATLEAASRRSSSSSDEVSDEDVQKMVQVQSMPIPITSEHPSGFWNTRPFDASRFFTGDGCGIKRWTLEGHPKRYTGPGIDVSKANTLARSNSDLGGPVDHPDNDDDDATTPTGPQQRADRGGRRREGGAGSGSVRASVDSLPQSPMLDLRMTTAVDGSKEFVPMGYNLGHDLGDFLKWEAEHVYASGFYGSD